MNMGYACINMQLSYPQKWGGKEKGVKPITTGEGGAIISKDKTIDQKLKLLRTHGIYKNSKKKEWHQDMKVFGYNYRITDFQCALGNRVPKSYI